MLSLIICSRDAPVLATVSQNVAATIGVPYELLAIDNSQSQYGICEAYNIGATQAQYPLLCFMHEDIAFYTQDWGVVVSRILADSTIGVLGVAGGTTQLAAPAGWGSAGVDTRRMRVMHTVGEAVKKIDFSNPEQVDLVDVAALDGLWLCCRKDVWQEFKFDKTDFPGFHFYDVDFCTRVFRKYRNCVTYEVLIEHYSYGSFNNAWYTAAIDFYKKRKSYLPFGVSSLSESDLKTRTINYWHDIIYTLREKRSFSIKEVLYCLMQCWMIDIFNRDTIWLFKDFLINDFKNSISVGKK